jgi:hypothetical protein
MKLIAALLTSLGILAGSSLSANAATCSEELYWGAEAYYDCLDRNLP